MDEQEELAAAENPGYGNSLLKKGRNSGIFQSSGKLGDTEQGSEIVKIYKIDPTAENVAFELETFRKSYAYALEEHSLVITPDGQCFEIRGGESVVHTEVVGAENLKGSIVIHNHPLDEISEVFYDSFSREDFAFAAEYSCGRQELVSGTLKNTLILKSKISESEAKEMYDSAFKAVRSQAFANGKAIDHEQLYTFRELKKMYPAEVDFYE